MYIEEAFERVGCSELTKDAYKVFKVYKTCKTPEHLEAADKMFELWRQKHGSSNTHDLAKLLINYRVKMMVLFQSQGMVYE